MCFFLDHQEYSFPTRMWGWNAKLEYDYPGIFKAGTSVLNKGLREFLYTHWAAVKKINLWALRSGLQEIPWCTDSKTPIWCQLPWSHLTPSCGRLSMSAAGTVTHFHTTEPSWGDGMAHCGYKHYWQLGVGLLPPPASCPAKRAQCQSSHGLALAISTRGSWVVFVVFSLSCILCLPQGLSYLFLEEDWGERGSLSEPVINLKPDYVMFIFHFFDF